MKIADGIEMLDLSIDIMGNKSIIHPMILWDKDKTILVDAGCPGQLSQIQEGFKKIGLSLSELDKLILTHHDIDHIGGAADIIKNLSKEIEIIAHKKERSYIHLKKRPIKIMKLESQFKSISAETKAIYENLKVSYKRYGVSVNRTVKSGENLPFCGGIKVIYTPGHTPGHISLYVKESKVLIAGDALFIENGMLTPPPKFINFNNDLALKSLSKFIQYDIRTVICYHGGVYNKNVNQSIAKLIKI